MCNNLQGYGLCNVPSATDRISNVQVTRLALMNSKLTQSLSMHNLTTGFGSDSDTSGMYCSELSFYLYIYLWNGFPQTFYSKNVHA